MENASELIELAQGAQSPCVSLYLNTSMKEPVARDRARRFVDQRFARARAAAAGDERLLALIERVFAEAKTRVRAPEDGAPRAVAVFAGANGMFRVLPLDVAVEDALSVGDGPALRQLALLSDEYERTLLALVSAEDARIFEVVLGGTAQPVDEVHSDKVNTKRADVQSPGWAELRYQRHVREHIDRHLREVAEHLTKLFDARASKRVVVGGPHPTIDRFLHLLPARIRTQVMDVVALPPEAPLTRVVDATIATLERQERQDEVDGVKQTIDLALADGPAALGVDEIVEAAREKRLMTLYLTYGFRATGARCRECEALARSGDASCSFCGGALGSVELSEALVRETIAQDGSVDFLPRSEELERFGGLAARLRW